MTDPTPLSPTAQAVLCAAARRYAIDGDLQDSIAAALRAAVAEVRTDRELKRHYAATMSEMLVLDKTSLSPPNWRTND